MQQHVSRKAIIREMDASEIEHEAALLRPQLACNGAPINERSQEAYATFLDLSTQYHQLTGLTLPLTAGYMMPR